MKIKGHTTIELFDAKTGKLVQRTDDDNMLTKALFYFYDSGGITNPAAFNAAAMRSDALHHLLGGVMCLDTALTESDELIRIPKGVGMTANGAYNVLNSGNPPELGSWSELESGWQQDNSYKMVWNFNTAQGNGTVACVCLSSLYGAFEGIGNKSNTRKDAGPVALSAYNSVYNKGIGAGQPVAYKNNILYVMESNFAGKTSVTVSKYKMPVTQLDIRTTMAAELVEEITVNLPANLQNLTPPVVDGYVNIIDVFISGNYGYILIGSGGGYDNRIEGTGYVAVFDVTTEQIINSYVVAASPDRVNMSGISDKYVVLGLKWYEFANQANNGDITDGGSIYDNASSAAHLYLETIDTDRFIASKNGAAGIIDIDTGKLLPINGASKLGNIGGFLTANNLLKVSGGLSVAAVLRDPRYIATINNLEAPITKDASKTMKVTYVLRFPN